MSRIRTVKPEFWSSKNLARVSLQSRLVFLGLWNFCDDFGVILDHTKTICGELFPHDDDIDGKFIDQCLCELEGIGVLTRDRKNGKDFIIIRGWEEHQQVDHPGKKRWLSDEEISEALAKPSRESRARNKEGGIGNEEGGRRKETRVRANGASHLPAALATTSPFDEFWAAYPHKIGKGAARKAFGQAINKTTLNGLLAGIGTYRQAKPHDRPWCNPSTWLNQERWLDSEGTPPRRTVFDLYKERAANGTIQPQESGDDVVCVLRPGEGNGKAGSVLDSIFGPKR